MISAVILAMMANSFPIQSFASESTKQEETEQNVPVEDDGTEEEIVEEKPDIPIPPENGAEGTENQEEGETETGESSESSSTEEQEETKPEIKPEIPPQKQIVSPKEEKPELQITQNQQSVQDESIKNDKKQVVQTTGNVSFRYTVQNDTQMFIALIGEQARSVGQENDLYASVMIAQAILESDSGNSMLSGAPNNNLFGIKGAFKGNAVQFNTFEDNGTGNLFQIQSSFRKYDTLKDSLEDYANLLKNGVNGNQHFYSGTWKSNTKDYKQATAFLTGRYATDIYYGQKLNSLIDTYDLTRFDVPKTGNKEKERAEVLAVATSYLGVPYVWGGTTPNGFDCSGLVQYIYKKALNIDLMRVTSQQENQGVEVSFNQLEAGDLLFFGERGNTHHVAIYLGNGYFIHAPQPGEVVKITNMKDFMPSFARRIIE